MSKRSVFTTITPLPPYMTRELALSTLHNHFEMIDLNPLVIARHRLTAPPTCASPEEESLTWYEITDKITYMPGLQSSISYNSCFNDLPDGLQTHTFAPAGVELRGRWTIGGSLPGEKAAPTELGVEVPRYGLYLREETDLKCSFLLAGFVKKNLKKSHATVVEKILSKARDGIGSGEIAPPGGAGREERRPVSSSYGSASLPDLNRGNPNSRNSLPAQYKPLPPPPDFSQYRTYATPRSQANQHSEPDSDSHAAAEASGSDRRAAGSMQPVELPAERVGPAELAG